MVNITQDQYSEAPGLPPTLEVNIVLTSYRSEAKAQARHPSASG